jgi:hypothetical protein
MSRLIAICLVAVVLLCAGGLSAMPVEATASRVYHTHQSFVCFSGGTLYLHVVYHDTYGRTYDQDWLFWGRC